MDLRKLKALIDLVSDSNVSELEITEAEGKIRIVKSAAVPAVALPIVTSSPVTIPVMPAPAPATVTVGDAPSPPAQELAPERTIKSPMVGTFYRSASPEASPFVDVGTTVKSGDTVCIIEAMKILNEIETDLAGTVKRILVDNGQAVEYGQALFVIE